MFAKTEDLNQEKPHQAEIVNEFHLKDRLKCFLRSHAIVTLNFQQLFSSFLTKLCIASKLHRVSSANDFSCSTEKTSLSFTSVEVQKQLHSFYNTLLNITVELG